ncbi:MAG: protein kinase [Planctomycetota bacterium]
MSDPVPPTMPPAPAGGPPPPEATPTLAGVDPSPTPRTAPASRFFGRYTLLDEIGRGGMGVVWKAWDNQLKRVVALKQILPGSTTSWEDLERFLREARLAARLRHPHIVSVYDAGAFEGQSYYTADFIEGRPLSDLMRRPLAPHDVARWIQGIAEALAYAHAQDVVHRDVKPGNILVAADGHAWLTDFGLAKQLRPGAQEMQAELTMKGAVLGTPHYMSPEQASGDGEVGPAGDQFSLAVVLYEALTGRRPFDGRTPFEVACEVMSREPATPRSVRPQIHPDLETICLRCLEKRPERRYLSMQEVAKDLERYLNGDAIQARPVSTIMRLARKVKEHRAAILATFAAVLVLGIATNAVVLRLRKGKDIASALSEGRDAKAKGMVPQARAAFDRAAQLDDECAEAREGIAWADAELDRAGTEALRQQEGLRKSSPVASVVSRWLTLKDVLIQIQRVALDPTIDAEAKKARTAPLWSDVDAFMKKTPGDPTSQATMLALAGWAKVLSGDKAVGIAWMDEARALDPDVPYGATMKATSRLFDFMHTDLRRLQDEGGEGAMAEFVKARARMHDEVDPLLAEVHRASVWGTDLAVQVETMIRITDAMATGKLTEADDLIAQVQVIPGMQPMAGSLSRLRGDIHVRNGDAKGALSHYTEAIQANPYIPGVQSDRAWVRHGMGDRKGAIADFTESLRLRPGDLQTLMGRARARGEEGDAAGELEDCDAAVRLAPELTAARYQRGVARLRQKDANGAVADLESVVAETSRDVQAWLQLAAARQALGDHAGAIAACDALIAFEPKNAAAFQSRGFARKQKGEIDAAIADFDRAIELKPAYPEALNNRGRAKYAKDDFDGAIADYSEAIRLKPDHVEGIGNRGRAKERKGDLAGALEDYDLALKLAPADWPHRALLEKLRAEALQKR